MINMAGAEPGSGARLTLGWGGREQLTSFLEKREAEDWQARASLRKHSSE